MTMLKNPIEEAERYMQNARQTLSEKAGKEGKFYKDQKYVRAAGNYAWNGVLLALDAVLNVRKNKKKGQRVDFQDYQMAMSIKDNKMNYPLLSAYESLHKALGYDGNPDFYIVQRSLKQGQFIIDWAAKHYSEVRTKS